MRRLIQMMRWHLCQCLPVDNLRIQFKILEETFNPYKEFELWEKVNKNSANSLFIGRVRPFDQLSKLENEIKNPSLLKCIKNQKLISNQFLINK